MTNLDLLKHELFGDPTTAIHDIKFDAIPRHDADLDAIAGSILAAIRDIRAGGGQDIDLTI